MGDNNKSYSNVKELKPQVRKCDVLFMYSPKVYTLFNSQPAICLMAANTHQVFGDVFIFSKRHFLIERNFLFFFYNKVADLAHWSKLWVVWGGCIEKMLEVRQVDMNAAFCAAGQSLCWSGCLSTNLWPPPCLLAAQLILKRLITW